MILDFCINGKDLLFVAGAYVICIIFFFFGGGKRVTIDMILHIMHIFCINGTDFELRVKNIKEQNRLNRCINSLDSASMVYISSASVA